MEYLSTEDLNLCEQDIFRILDFLPIGICIFDQNWQLSYCNKRISNEMKASFSDVEGNKWMSWLFRYNQKLTVNKIQHFLNTFGDIGFDNQRIEIINSEGKTMNYLISVDKKKIREDTFRICILQEITESHKVEIEALEFKKKFSRDLKMAKKMQNNINNSIINQINGKKYIYNFYSKFLSSEYLSGDVMNVNRIDDRFFSVFIGDGRGHGLPAALYASLIYSYLNLFAIEVNMGERNTSTLVEKINKIAYRDFIKGKEYYFFSGIFMLIDLVEDSFVITNAGHPHPFFIQDNEIHKLESNGSILGVTYQSTYTQKKFKISGNQTLILYTDGLLEMHDENNQPFGQNGILKFLLKYTQMKKPTSVLYDELLKYTVEHSGSSQEDDISILVLDMQSKDE